MPTRKIIAACTSAALMLTSLDRAFAAALTAGNASAGSVPVVLAPAMGSPLAEESLQTFPLTTAGQVPGAAVLPSPSAGLPSLDGIAAPTVAGQVPAAPLTVPALSEVAKISARTPGSAAIEAAAQTPGGVAALAVAPPMAAGQALLPREEANEEEGGHGLLEAIREPLRQKPSDSLWTRWFDGRARASSEEGPTAVVSSPAGGLRPSRLSRAVAPGAPLAGALAALPLAAASLPILPAAFALGGAWAGASLVSLLTLKKVGRWPALLLAAGALAGGMMALGAVTFAGVLPTLAGLVLLAAAVWALPALHPTAERAIQAQRGRAFAVYDRGGVHYMALREGQLEKPFLISATIEKGLGEHELYGTFPAGERLVYFRRSGDRVQLVAKNMDFRAEPGSPMERALGRSIGDSILATARIAERGPGYLSFNLKDIFLADLFNLRGEINAAYDSDEYYELSRKASALQAPKAFPRNVELAADLVYSAKGALPSRYLPDSRNLSIGMRYSLSALPEDGYAPRRADERVGYFSTVFQDWSDPTKEDVHTRLIHRWRLEKADPSAAVSPVKKPIVWWIENTVPHEFREAVRRGILAWNKAFEKIGLKDAIVVRQQPDPVPAEKKGQRSWAFRAGRALRRFLDRRAASAGPEDVFDPADARFNVFRWYLGVDQVFAFGPLRADPRTGQIYNASVHFSAGMTQSIERILGMIREHSDAAPEDHRHDLCGANCRVAAHAAAEAALTLALESARVPLSAEERTRIISDYVTDIVIHEIGHTLGLRHNFKSGVFKTAEELHQTSDGVIGGSAMGYLPVNLSPPGEPQGSFFQTALGPYDELAVEYGYKPIAGSLADVERELDRIAGRTNEPGLGYATDEDAWAGLDPDSQPWELGKDPVQFAINAAVTVADYWSKLQERELPSGASYQPLVRDYWLGWRKYFQAVNVAATVVGGVRHRRVRAGAGVLPAEPVSEDEQLKALEFLRLAVFNETLFAVSPDFLAKLAPERAATLAEPYPLLYMAPYQEVVTLLRTRTLQMLLDPERLRRIVEARHLQKQDAPTLSLEQLFSFFEVAAWPQLSAIKEELDKRDAARKRAQRAKKRAPRRKTIQLEFSPLQRELHLALIDALSELSVASEDVPEDATALASRSLEQIKEAAEAVADNADVAMYPLDRAHLQEMAERASAGGSSLGKMLRSRLGLKGPESAGPR